jgi:integrase
MTNPMNRKPPLTRKSIRALRNGERITEKGITAQKLTDGVEGDVRYSINVMVDGERHHRIIGKGSEGVTLTQAQEAIETLRTRAREDRLDLPKGRKIAMPFKEAADSYIKRLKEEGGKTIERKERVLELYLTPALGVKPLSKITSSDLAVYRTQRRKAGAKDATINREMAVVSHLYSKAVDWGWVAAKPKITRAKEGDGRIAYLTPEQCARIIAAARNDVSPHIHPFCVIALSTSMRMSEVLSIKPEHIDFDKRRIFIPSAKAGQREQPITKALSDFLKPHLEGLPDDVEWLFPNSASQSGRVMTIRKAHRRVVKAAGLNPDEVLRHTFRHTAITHLVQAGVDLPTVQKVSGHKTLAMVARYAHANGEHIDAAMDNLEQRIALPI